VTAPELDIYLDDRDLARSLRADVRAGLTATPKWLPPKWFYDATGSTLFEEITRLPEYYPTRAERAVLDARAPQIARITAAKTLVELGSGSSRRPRWARRSPRWQRSTPGFRFAASSGTSPVTCACCRAAAPDWSHSWAGRSAICCR
jgi:uncharacterized SAM-dependent methyltransferase